MTDLIMIAGPNGSGKSTIRDIVPLPADVVIDPDRIAREINPGDPRSVDQPAAREALRRFDEALRNGRSILMETTLTGHGAVQRMRRAKDAGYDVSLVYVALETPELNVARVASRVRQGGHFIEPDTIMRRVQTSLRNLPAALAIADQAAVLDNSGPRHLPLLETSARRVTFLAERLPAWLASTMPAIVAGLAPPTVAPGKRASPLTGVMNALRAPAASSPTPWTSPATSIADRLAQFQNRAQTIKTAGSSAGPEQADDPDLSQGLRPKRGPEP